MFPCFFSRCIPWIFGIIYILTIFHLNRISDLWITLFSILNWLISLESHITLNFLFYVLNVPNRLSGIARVLSYCCVLNLRIQCRPSAFLVLFIDVHSIDNTFGIKHVPASIQSFCPGDCFSVSGLGPNEILTYHTHCCPVSQQLYTVLNPMIWILLLPSKGFHNTNIDLMWIESSRASATISPDFCTFSIFSVANLIISCYIFLCSWIQPYTHNFHQLLHGWCMPSRLNTQTIVFSSENRVFNLSCNVQYRPHCSLPLHNMIL